MNIIDQLVHLRKDLTNLNQILLSVKANLADHADEVKIAGKTLKHANAENASLFGYYDEIRVHLQSLLNFIEIKLTEKRAAVIRYISENSPHDHGERMKEKLIDEDPGYIDWKLKYLEVEEVLEHTKSICEQFKRRGYNLTNLTNLAVAQVDDEYIILKA